MADTSKKSTKSTAKKQTNKKNTSKKTVAKTTVNASKKAVAPVKEVKTEVVKEAKTTDVKKVATTPKKEVKKDNKIVAYVKSLPEKIVENTTLVIIMLVVGLLLGMGLLAILGFRRIPKLSNGEEVIISMNEGNITSDQLYTELKNGYGLTIVMDKIDSMILENKYPDTDEIKSYIDSQIEYLKTSYGDQFEEYIKYYGFESEEKVREYFSLNYKRNLALLDYAKGLVTDAEVQDYYDNTIFGDIEASHILIKFDSSDEDSKNAALDKANDIIEQLNNSDNVAETFATLAKENSEDTANAENGGTLGYFGAGEMEAAFEAAAKALEVGAYTTTPVQTSYGYHIILKTNQKEKTALSEVKDEILETLGQQKLTSDTQTQYKAIEELRNNSKVSFKDAELRQKYEEYLADLYKTDEE